MFVGEGECKYMLTPSTSKFIKKIRIFITVHIVLFICHKPYKCNVNRLFERELSGPKKMKMI